jgi:hypothetical protein
MSSQSKSTSSKSPAAGGAGKKGGKRVGRAAIRADSKNAECCDDYVTRLTSSCSYESIYDMADDHVLLGRITKNVGCGSVQVLLQSGITATIPIGGSIRFKGRAATKSDRSNCMITGDVVVVDGGFAAGKLSCYQVVEVRRLFKTAGFGVPAGFFCTPGEAQDDDADETGFEFDRSGGAFDFEEEEETTGPVRERTAAPEVDIDLI